MVQIYQGDLFDIAQSGYIIHQVNCQNVMGAGFAKAFYEHYPAIKEQYHHYCNNHTTAQRINQLQEVPLSNQLIGVNSYTQFYYGNAYQTKQTYTNENALINNIQTIAQKAQSQNVNVYIPENIGCGLAGGNWDTIFNGIKDINNIVIANPTLDYSNYPNQARYQKEMTQPINQNQQTNEFHVAFTGHRPNNFPILKKPYEENQPFYRIMKQNIDNRLEQLIQNNPDKTIYGHTGLALGSDFIWTKSLIDMRQKYPNNIKIVADLAQTEPNEKWHPDTKAEYRQLLKQADHVIDHSQLHTRNVYDQRDKEMIKIADAVIGVVDTNQKQTGTYKALTYAYQLGKPISWFTPQQIIQQMTDNQKQNTLNIETIYQKAAKKLVNHGPKIQDGYGLSLTGHRAYKAKRDANGQIMYDQYGQQIVETKLDTNVKTFSQANDLTRPYYQNLQKHLEDVIEANVQSKGLVNCHSGMALGADTVWAHAIVAMKEKYPNQVRFIADIPNTSQANKWNNPKIQQHWVDLLKQADEVNDWSYGDTYKNKQMQDRNKAMIDSCDTLIAIYDNSNEPGSGTANAHNYAKEIGKDIYRADPRLFDNGVPEVPEQFKAVVQEMQTQDVTESTKSIHYTTEESMEKLTQLIIDYHIRQEENDKMPIDEFRERLLQTVSENERETFAKELENQEDIVQFAANRRIEYDEQQQDVTTDITTTETTKTKVADNDLEL